MKYKVLILTILILILYINYKIRKYKIKRAGRIGEVQALKYVKKTVENTGAIVYNNIIFPLYEDKTEIDILIVTNQGIICIENKHVVGKISGNLNDHYWKQQKINKIKKMYNPIMQNNGHIKCLQFHFNKHKISDVKICGYVIFSNEKSKLVDKLPNVGYLDDFNEFYNKIYSNKKALINVKKVCDIIDNIKIN
jgi:hypothetical protein